MAAGAPWRMGVECDKLDYESLGHITAVILRQMAVAGEVEHCDGTALLERW